MKTTIALLILATSLMAADNRQCAAQAEKVIGGMDSRDHSVFSFHYSPKYEHCFMTYKFEAVKDPQHRTGDTVDIY